jgi:hypothetical protein
LWDDGGKFWASKVGYKGGAGLEWEVITSLAAGLAIAGILVAWPRPALICLGIVSLLLGMLALATLKLMNIPALVAVLGGIGLIGFGRLVGAVDQLLRETRMQRDQKRTVLEEPRPLSTIEVNREPAMSDERIEPRP